MAENNVAITATIAVVTAALGFGLGQMHNARQLEQVNENAVQQIQALQIDSAVLPISGSPVKGARNPKATIVVFTDFKTPANTQLYHEYLKKIQDVHGNNVAIVYKSFPLKQNPDSQLRAKAAMAAHLQNKFWEMADLIIDFPAAQTFDENAVRSLAAKIQGLDSDKLLNDMKSDQISNMIQTDINLGTRLAVKSAPSIFINETPVTFKGNITQDELLVAVNTEIKRMDEVLNSPAGNYYLSSLIHAGIPANSAMDPLGRPARGAIDPLVTIVEYSDYECPFCSKVEPTIAEILNAYPKEVRVVFNHNPLPFHKNARLAHQAAYAASKQGKFWEMHDMIFKNQKRLTEDNLIRFAGSIGLNIDKFKADLKSAETVAAIDKALKIGEDNGISGTPSFVINGEPLTGALPFEKFKEVIDNNIQKARSIQAKTGLHGEALYQEVLKTAPKPKPRPQQPQVPEGKVFVDISGAPFFGDANAPVTIVEFTDFECPFCSKGNNTVKELIQKNPGKVKLVFKNNPLPFHKHADAAHRAAEAAALQGKFWEMYNKLFENQKKLEQSDIEGYAQDIGLDMAKFKADMESSIVKSRIEADLKQGSSVGVRGTPHFFMNGTRISGAQPLEKFQENLDKELQIADKYIKRGVPADDLYKTIISQEPKPAPAAVAPSAAPAAPKAPIVMEQGKSYAKGPANAPVVIYQFSEFQCPFCSRVEPTVAQIEEKYGDKVRIVFKNFPLAFHSNAALASEAALAAGAQNPDKFWEMHDLLFKNQKALARDNLIAYASEIGLDVEKFTSDLDNHTYKAQVDQEMKEGQNAGISGTPSFVINGKLVVGALPFEKFQTEIDAALEAKK